MSLQEKEFLKVIKLFGDNNCLKDIVIIGSWAEYLYQQSSLIPRGTISLRTLDIDFLITNLRKPNPPINIEALARDEGYAVDHDVLLGTTKIRTTSRLELEFLIAQRGSGHKATYKTALGVTAQGLRHLDILSDNTIVISEFGFEILVPIPEAYILHKMIINDERNLAKKVKDRANIIALYPHIDLNKFNSLIEKLSVKNLKKVKSFLTENNLSDSIVADLPQLRSNNNIR